MEIVQFLITIFIFIGYLYSSLFILKTRNAFKLEKKYWFLFGVFIFGVILSLLFLLGLFFQFLIPIYYPINTIAGVYETLVFFYFIYDSLESNFLKKTSLYIFSFALLLSFPFYIKQLFSTDYIYYPYFIRVILFIYCLVIVKNYLDKINTIPILRNPTFLIIVSILIKSLMSLPAYLLLNYYLVNNFFIVTIIGAYCVAIDLISLLIIIKALLCLKESMIK